MAKREVHDAADDSRAGSGPRRRWPAAVVAAVVTAAVAAGIIALVAHRRPSVAQLERNSVHYGSVIVGPISYLNLAHDYRGKVVVVSYVASPCAACRQEIPALVKTYDRYRHHGVQLIGVSYRTSVRSTRSMIHRSGIDFPVYLDATGAAARRRFHVKSVPTTLVYERGRLLKRFDGAVSAATLAAYLAQVAG